MTSQDLRRIRRYIAHTLGLVAFSLLTFASLISLWHTMEWADPSELEMVMMSVGCIVFADFCAIMAFPLRS